MFVVHSLSGSCLEQVQGRKTEDSDSQMWLGIVESIAASETLKDLGYFRRRGLVAASPQEITGR